VFMSSSNPIGFPDSSHLPRLTIRGCQVARMAAEALATGIATNNHALWEELQPYEEELDSLDRQINEDVTAAVARGSGTQARELLACLKFILELERIGDLLLNAANRFQTVSRRLQPADSSDLSRMASILTSMLGKVEEAFTTRDVGKALSVLKADAEIDRLRNLIFVRHIENPDRTPRQESFHLVFICQALERAGDHAKNLAEEICHLVSGRSVRHILREQDRPDEQVYIEKMRKAGGRL
jgi:phosphate transport system protein